MLNIQIQPQLDQNITIIDAKDSGMEYEEIRQQICDISSRAFQGEPGNWPEIYLKKEYFNGESLLAKGFCPETILLAKNNTKIIGFLITEKKQDSLFEYQSKKNKYTTFNTTHVAYVATDPEFKGHHIGTKLMLSTMLKTQHISKQYLTLTYKIYPEEINPTSTQKQLSEARIKFYNSLTSKFGIPMKERHPYYEGGSEHISPYYNVENIDFDSIIRNLNN